MLTDGKKTDDGYTVKIDNNIDIGIASVTVEKLDEINVPFKPEDDVLPKLELDVADVKEDSISSVPKWRR